jgi:hypothetical protein
MPPPFREWAVTCCIRIRKWSRSSARPTHQYAAAVSPRAVPCGTPERCHPPPADEAASDPSPIAAYSWRCRWLAELCWRLKRLTCPLQVVADYTRLNPVQAAGRAGQGRASGPQDPGVMDIPARPVDTLLPDPLWQRIRPLLPLPAVPHARWRPPHRARPARRSVAGGGP